MLKHHSVCSITHTWFENHVIFAKCYATSNKQLEPICDSVQLSARRSSLSVFISTSDQVEYLIIITLCVCVFSPISLYVWDISDLNNIRRRLSHFYHSRGVWSIDCFVDTCSNLSPSLPTSTTSSPPSWWTSGTFVTCADDGTIRFWSLGDESANDGVTVAATSQQDLSECGLVSDKFTISEVSGFTIETWFTMSTHSNG